MSSMEEIVVTRREVSRREEVSFDDLGFGDLFSDHMLICEWEDRRWGTPKIIPRQPLAVDPAALGLHYGQSVFEGLKAYHGTRDGKIRLFRPERNAARLASSCERLCIPVIEASAFRQCVTGLVAAEVEWVPRARGEALYIRPMIFANEGHLAVRPATRYTFVIVAAPVGQYFARYNRALRLKAESTFTRAVPGGTGAAKTAGNYGATLRPMLDAGGAGFDQILWLDAHDHAFAEEAGQMNIFFRLRDEVVTPDLSGTILPGVTRESVLTMLEDWGIATSVRRISIAELAKASQDGTLLEIFGAGTAAVVVPIQSITFRDTVIQGRPGGSALLSERLCENLLAIQHGEAADPRGWTQLVETG